ncbi:MAG: acetolactate synthase large subunit, partial [archaeon]|nr:acetolactate synthase large subunit [archaeon]
YSLQGINVERASEISDALKSAIKSDETIVLNVHVKKDALVLPIVPAGAGNSEMIGKGVPKGYFEK